MATLDRLSGGRVTLGAGLGGVPTEFTVFGQPMPSGAELDSCLSLVSRLLSGDEVRFTADGPGVRLAPLPVQRPVPIWIGSTSPAAARCAERWGGWMIAGDDEQGRMAMAPDQVPDYSGELALIGVSEPGSSVKDYTVSWWLEHLHGYRGTYDELLDRVRAGPPR
ncbi:hypothetical protein GCM10010404_83320 [Nonomuraea africana]|uniref:Alkanesulfonate monooxygenase SsuD/methylene tetrahydromethanopterin reductase-like flavin-dependent oxidoreductase (Luciferase family) n=1 Tax=Nonomuraea africana TaxID=46171 RepID=A0ABR9KJF0_9ACTN|nr:LLM class flavin-dependent oxidoreductase [Nonomuraea africana]MBE1562139.1 alkanesulfonate monooxygenase SsuD/methylene tetrahydromethanopterin reductase-like flavin-dependent oxidoreductase (luciferase family) [Nonomuraea africana]